MEVPNVKLYRTKEVCKMYDIVSATLRNWEKEGRIECIRTSGGHRRYILKENKTSERPKRKICYCRVSSPGQKKDLERQIEYVRNRFPDYEIIKDIGSGLNFKRKGLGTILELAKNGDIETVVVTHRDRLCRFGFELIEKIIKDWSNGTILVLDQQETSPEKELTDDLISIITVFSARVHGLRSYKIKEKIKEVCDSSEPTAVQDNEI